MSGLPWFRMYTEAVDDYKLRLLAFEDRWHYVAILCCKGQGVLDSTADPQMKFRYVAVKLGVQVRELEEIARRLAEVGLIDKDTLQPLSWDKRQFTSDRSAERVARHREKRKKEDVTLQKRFGNVLDTDTESDTEKEEETTQTADAVRAAAASSRLAPEPGLKKQIDCPYSELAALYATHFPHKRQPRTLSARRKALLLKGWKHGLVTRKRDKSEMLYTDTASGVEFWGRFMAHIANNCRFCMQVQNNFDIEWLFSPRAIDNIIDGKYDTVRDGGRSIT